MGDASAERAMAFHVASVLTNFSTKAKSHYIRFPP